jgi:hypothetical protein
MTLAILSHTQDTYEPEPEIAGEVNMPKNINERRASTRDLIQHAKEMAKTKEASNRKTRKEIELDSLRASRKKASDMRIRATRHPRCALDTLEIGCCDIGATGVNALGKALAKNHTLTRLGLAGREPRGTHALSPSDVLGANGVQILIEHLSQNETLCDLDLSCNGLAFGLTGEGVSPANVHNLGEEGGLMLKENLSKLRKVTKLDLSGNRLGPIGAQYLADGLKTNFCIRQLDLSRNGIKDFGAVRLCDVVLSNWTLTDLNLGLNGISKWCTDYRLRQE